MDEESGRTWELMGGGSKVRGVEGEECMWTVKGHEGRQDMVGEGG